MPNEYVSGMDASPLWAKARELDKAAASARQKRDDCAFAFWLGETDPTQMASTLHMCANVWRAAAVVVEAG